LEEVQGYKSVISTVSIVNNRRGLPAIMIQKHFRRFVAQRLFKERRAAGIRIQKLGRGGSKKARA